MDVITDHPLGCHHHVTDDEQSLTGLLTVDGTHRGSEFYVPCSHVKITAWFVICRAECIDILSVLVCELNVCEYDRKWEKVFVCIFKGIKVFWSL